MLSKKIVNLFREREYIALSESEKEEYSKVLMELGIPLNSCFAEFNLLTIGPSFGERGYELYNVCWFKLYSMDLDYAIAMALNVLKLPEEYLPLSSFECESGFFYNRNTEEVVYIELGESLIALQNNKLKPQWKDFNAFLEWFFKVENV